MSQQGRKQASVRAVTGTEESYEGDWHRLFDAWGVPAELVTATATTTLTFNERMLLWLNAAMGSAYDNLAEAQQAFAEANGAANWSSLGTFDATPPEEG